MVPLKIILTIALTMALSTTLAMRTTGQVILDDEEPGIDIDDDDEPSNLPSELAAGTYINVEKHLIPSRRLSRFLAEEAAKDTDADDPSQYCKKTCKHEKGKRMNCCGSKCVDKNTDPNNCGKCGKKCKLTQTCCGGHCVYLSTNKRHCGKCRHRCPGKDPVCTLGLCNYA